MSKIRIIEDNVVIPVGLQNIMWSIFLYFVSKNSDIHKRHVFKYTQEEYALEIKYENFLKAKDKKPTFKQKYVLPIQTNLSELGTVTIEVNGDIYTMKMKE